MSRIAARTNPASLFFLFSLVVGWASPDASSSQAQDEQGQGNHTSYWPLITNQSSSESEFPEHAPILQNTGSGGQAAPAFEEPLDFKLMQAVTVIEVAEKLAREVYVQGEFIMPITQQPPHRNTYVSTQLGVLTQFDMAARNGVTGLLAHNYLSGAQFYLLDVGEEIDVLYADGHIQHYRVSKTLSFQKLESLDLYSDYLDMQTGKMLSTAEVFKQVYRGPHHLTLQTCLEQNGNLSWGLYFVIATPLEKS